MEDFLDKLPYLGVSAAVLAYMVQSMRLIIAVTDRVIVVTIQELIVQLCQLQLRLKSFQIH